MSKIDDELFSAHQHGLINKGYVCPECGGELKIRNSKAGSFVGCSNHPNCNYIKSSEDQGILRELDDKPCPECRAKLAIKKGRYGLFVGCSNFPECHYHESLEQPQETLVVCPKCKKGNLLQRKSRFGKAFYACDGYPKCKFAVNFKPITGNCQKCHYPLLLEKSNKEKSEYICADKKCNHIQNDQQ